MLSLIFFSLGYFDTFSLLFIPVVSCLLLMSPAPSPPGLLGSMGDSAPLQLFLCSVFSSHFTFLKFLKKENQKYNPALTMTALIYYY